MIYFKISSDRRIILAACAAAPALFDADTVVPVAAGRKNLAKHVKSNAIVDVKDGATVESAPCWY